MGFAQLGFGENRCPNLPVIKPDGCNTQMRRVSFVLRAFQMNVVFVCGPSFARKGHLQCAHSIGAFGYHHDRTGYLQHQAPLQRSAFYKLLQGASVELASSLHNDDGIILFFWPAICFDMVLSGTTRMPREPKRFLRNFVRPHPQGSTAQW